jgi:hypothetical protein
MEFLFVSEFNLESFSMAAEKTNHQRTRFDAVASIQREGKEKLK